MTGDPLSSTIVLLADHTMETLNRVVTVLRARRYRIVALSLEPSETSGLAELRIRLDPSSGTVPRAVMHLQRIEEVHQARLDVS